MLLVLSRWAAFPASLWDRDEAIFARALVCFEPESLYPHPPFFPLWIAAGRLILASPLTAKPEVALQLLSSVMSIWIVFPLARLWRYLLPRYQASLAALLFATIPAPWILSGRAYTGGTATAFLVAAAALLFPDRRPVNERWLGAIYLSACLLVRPQLLPFALAIGVWRIAREQPTRRLLGPVAVCTTIILGVAAWMTHRCGGISGILDIVAVHTEYHFGRMERVVREWHNLGIVAGLGGGAVATTWLLLAFQGAAVLFWRHTRQNQAVGFFFVLSFPALYFQLGLHNPSFVRYSLPFYAFSCGLVVAAVAWMTAARLKTQIAVSILCSLSAAMVLPHLDSYRQTAAPVVRALNEIADFDPRKPVDLFVDPHLETFLELYLVNGRINANVTVLPRETQGVNPFEVHRLDRHLVAVIDENQGRWDIRGRERSTHSWQSTHWFERIVSPRFRRIVVVYGHSGDGSNLAKSP